MIATAYQSHWTKFLKSFNEQNSGRPTRLGVFDKKNGDSEDYWIENGLPLSGIDVDPGSGKDSLTIEIILGDNDPDGARHFTHCISGVRIAKIILSSAGAADGLEIEDAEGKTTILRFEG